jgi:hypothetical protein
MRNLRGKVAARKPAHARRDAAERGDDAPPDEPAEQEAESQGKAGRHQAQAPAVGAGGAHGVESGALPCGAGLAHLVQPRTQDSSCIGALDREADEVLI